MPITNSVDQIFQDEKYLTTALIEHPKPRTPYLEFGDATLNALKNQQAYLLGPPQPL